ncbi:tyrosine-type recombinase/integrase [Corticicoccus populi]|uniref:Tyrosine-type recombinase/integrase n=1 Tax=Corticicoccus populi TaxID=1812821 RepID=A0ABW5WUR6_9STAP
MTFKKKNRPRMSKKKDTSVITLSDLYRISYQHVSTLLAESTSRRYRVATEELLNFFGDVELNILTVADAYDFTNYLRYEKKQYEGVDVRKDFHKIGLKSSSVNNYITTIAAAINILYELEYLDEKDYKNVFLKVKKIKEDKKKPRQVSSEDLKDFMKELDIQYYADLRMKTAIYTFLESYCRVGELCSLKVGDIDFQANLITFNKTKNSNFRVVPVSKKVIRMLQVLIKESEVFDKDYVFYTNSGTPMTPGGMRKQFYLVSERAGLDENITPHRLRHSSSVEFLKNGGDIRSLQKMLGHSDIQTTTIYLNIHDNTLVEAQSKYSPLSILNGKTNAPATTKARRRRYDK